MSVHAQQSGVADVPQRAPGLHWGIKDSFLDYVASTRDGQCIVGGGASPDPLGVFHFAPAPLAASASHEQKYTGEVRFEAHYGILSVRVADPWIIIKNGQGSLSVLDPSSARGKTRLKLVTFAVDTEMIGRGLPWTATDVRLAAAGVPVFNDVYPELEPFAPLLVVPTAERPAEEAPHGPVLRRS